MPVFVTSFLGVRAHAVGAGAVLTSHRCSNRIMASHVGLNHTGHDAVIAQVLFEYAGIRIQLLMCSGLFRWHGHDFDGAVRLTADHIGDLITLVVLVQHV